MTHRHAPIILCVCVGTSLIGNTLASRIKPPLGSAAISPSSESKAPQSTMSSLFQVSKGLPFSPECMADMKKIQAGSFLKLYNQQTQATRDKSLRDCHQKGICQREVYASASEEARFAKSCADANGKVCRMFADYQNVDFITWDGQKHITEASTRPFTSDCVATSCPSSNEELKAAYSCGPMKGTTTTRNGTTTSFSFPCIGEIWCEEPCQKNTNGNCIKLFDQVDRSVGTVVFVLDFSGSMDRTLSQGGSTRLALMKSQMVSVLKSLSQDQMFTVVKFGTTVTSLSATAMKATKDNVEKATSWITSSTTMGNTNVQGALESAFKVPNANVIYLLTDGAPTVGCKDVPCLIMGHGDTKVNTVLFDHDAQATFRELIKGIADQTGGTFREPLTE